MAPANRQASRTGLHRHGRAWHQSRQPHPPSSHNCPPLRPRCHRSKKPLLQPAPTLRTSATATRASSRYIKWPAMSRLHYVELGACFSDWWSRVTLSTPISSAPPAPSTTQPSLLSGYTCNAASMQACAALGSCHTLRLGGAAAARLHLQGQLSGLVLCLRRGVPSPTARGRRLR